VNQGLIASVVLSLAIRSDGTLIAGTLGNGLFLSRDQGESFRRVLQRTVDGSALMVTRGGTFLAGTPLGIFLSRDGESWTLVGLENLPVHSLLAAPSGTLFAGTEIGIFRSEDGGATWRRSGLFGRRVFALAASSDGQLFAGTGNGIFRSTDDGRRWSGYGLSGIAGIGGRKIRALVVTKEMLFAAVEDGGIFRTPLQQKPQWTRVTTGLTSLDVRALVATSEGHLFAGTAHGVFRSRDLGENWAPVNVGLTNLSLRALALDRHQVLYAGTEGSGIFRSKRPVSP
jgi:ligand-binding sensor domain-containing protein